MDLVERKLGPAPTSKRDLQGSWGRSDASEARDWHFDPGLSDAPPQRRKKKDRRVNRRKLTVTPPKFPENSLQFVLKIDRNKRVDFGQLLPMQKLSSKKSKNVVKRVLLGMNRGLNPEPVSGGLSGSYFLLDRFRNREAIFKPRHEEPFAPLNPKGFRDSLGTEVHASDVRSGEMYLREAAAHVIDDRGLFDVPETFLAVVKHPFFKDAHERRDLMSVPQFVFEDPSGEQLSIELVPEHSNDHFNILNLKVTDQITRVGSVQKVVPNCSRLENLSTSKLSAFEVQKVALLDMRLLNATRTEADVLVKRHKGRVKLVPINHGMSLGRRFQIERDALFWTRLPQIRLPLDSRLVRFVQKLRPKETVQKLSKRLGLPTETLNLVRKAETFIKECVRRKMTIHEMVQLFYRNGQEKAPLEKTIESVDFMSKHSKTRDKWFLQNRILVKSKKFSNRKLDERISRIRNYSDVVGCAKRRLGRDSQEVSTGRSQIFKLNLQTKIARKNQKSTKNEGKTGLDEEKQKCILQSPQTFLSKNESQSKLPLLKPFFNENDQMKSLNTFSTENPVSPFVKNGQLQLISFSSLEMVEQGPQQTSQTEYKQGKPGEGSFHRRRRINSEVIQTSVDKDKPVAACNKKSAFFGLNNLNFQKLYSMNASSQTLSQSKVNLESQAQRAPATRKVGQTSRSLSVFQIRLKKKEPAKSGFLDDFLQENGRCKLSSLTDLSGNDPFLLRKEDALPRKNLRLHYFKCCVEQLLDGWSFKRPFTSAKRKNTAPLVK